MTEDQNIETRVLSSSGEALFKVIEEEFKAKIPSLIKKVLIFCEYNHAIVLAKLDDASINTIEEDIRNDLCEDLLVDGEVMKDFLGRFENCQQKFKFLVGQRKWFGMIAEFCRRFAGEIAPLPAATTPDNVASLQNGESPNQSIHVWVKKYSYDSPFRLIGGQMITIFNDAKRITLSAWSWPSREVAFQLASSFKATGTVNANVDLMYTTPTHHAELLDCIVQTDLERFKSSLCSSLAMSLRIDGSVDRSQKHNVYVIMHVITNNGLPKTFFLGFDIPVGNSALSYQKVTQKIVGEILPWNVVLRLTTSLATDGENKNKGHLLGLWKRLKDEKSESSSDPFITIWCIGHRVNLGWKATCELPIITELINNVSSVASYFHQSGEKTRLLVAIAAEKQLNAPLHYPQHFELRWSEFTHNLLYVFLRNWNAMTWHFKSTKATGFENMWLCEDRVRLVAFVCDVLTVVKTFQKKFQSNSISILHLLPERIKLIDKLTTLKVTPLENGWEELFLKEVVTSDDGNISLRGHNFLQNTRLRRGLFTFSNNDRNTIVDSLIRNLNVYFDEDADVQKGLAPLLMLDPNVDQDALYQCHSIIVPEMESEVFCIEYYEAAKLLSTDERKDPLQNVLKLEQNSSKQFGVLKLALARAYAIKPHSADIENIINVYNKYKDRDRQLLSKKTLFNNIHVHTNMCDLIEFDPTSAAQYWLNQKERRPRPGTKSEQQEWFKGVFPEAKHYQRHSSRKIEF